MNMRTAIDAKRISINVPTETLNRIDDYATKMNINRTSAIVVLCNQMLDNTNAMDALSAIKDMMTTMDKAKA